MVAEIRIQVEREGLGVRVRVEGVAGWEQLLTDGLRRCSPGAWACQCGECMNVESVHRHVVDGVVYLALSAKPGAELCAQSMEQCLRLVLPAAVLR